MDDTEVKNLIDETKSQIKNRLESTVEEKMHALGRALFCTFHTTDSFRNDLRPEPKDIVSTQDISRTAKPNHEGIELMLTFGLLEKIDKKGYFRIMPDARRYFIALREYW